MTSPSAPHRVLFASLPVGGGHRALSDSLLTSLGEGSTPAGAYEPRRFDSQDTKLRGIYEFCVHRAPWLQRLQYSLSDLRLTLPVLASTNPQLEAEVLEALERERPDAVVSTHFLVAAMFVRARRRLGLRLPVINAIPDYGRPTEVFAPRGAYRLDGLIVMEPRVREQLLRDRPYAPARVHLGGFIPRAPFVEVGTELGAHARLPEARRHALLETLRAEHPALAALDPTRPTLLFLGGSAWTGKTRPVLERLLRAPALLERLNLVVVCGQDAHFHAALEARTAGRSRVAVLGFVAPQVLARLMALAHVPVLGSLAPASLHELMETRCGPLLLFHVIPGSEDTHPDYIREHEVGLYEPRPAAMVDRIAEATGLRPPSEPLRRLLAVAPERMRALRADNRERAPRLGAFLQELLRDSAPRALAAPAAPV
jgi:processive 1,2-diacylglycerol beta-glucosyltransferase